MAIIVTIIGFVLTFLWFRFLTRVGQSVLRIEKHIILLLQNTSPSKEAAETLEQIRGLRGDLATHWGNAAPGRREPVALRTPAPRPGEFFYSDEAGKAQGPHTATQMRRFFERGIVTADTPVNGGGDAEWTSYSEILT